MAVAARLPQLSTEDQISTEDQTAIPELLVDTTGHSGRERFIDRQAAITTLEEATPPARVTFSSTGHPTAHRNLSSIDPTAHRDLCPVRRIPTPGRAVATPPHWDMDSPPEHRTVIRATLRWNAPVGALRLLPITARHSRMVCRRQRVVNRRRIAHSQLGFSTPRSDIRARVMQGRMKNRRVQAASIHLGAGASLRAFMAAAALRR